MRGTSGRPLSDLDARAEAIRAIFVEQHKLLGKLFPRDGATMVARSLSAALAALRSRDKRGNLMLAGVPPEEIARACIACHHLGVEPGTEAYLVPFTSYGTTQLQVIVGPQGMIRLMSNAGWRVEARAVREGDFFEHDLGDEGFVRHRKAVGRRGGEITYAYAIGRSVDGGPALREVLTRDDIEAYRALSKIANGPMWTDHFEGAARKTAIKRLAEFVPRPAFLAMALKEDDAGAYEIPEEVWSAVRTRKDAPARAPAPADETPRAVAEDAVAEEPAREATAREPGSDG